MTKPRLSICIATYNRAAYIGETLNSIIPQLTEEVEIVIADGASTDDTGSVVEAYAKTCKQLRYIRLPVKGGFDQDYCKVVELARGEMCWLFPDDDLFRPDAIRTVLSEMNKGYSLILVNAKVMNKDFSKTLEDKRLLIDQNEVYSGSELDPLFRRAISYMSFIGCVVINRDVWLQREKERYWGTYFIHIGVIFQALLPQPALVIAEPYILIRTGNAQWTTRAFEIGMFKWPKLLCSFADISEQSKQPYLMAESWRRLKNVIVCRAKNEYNLEKYREYFKPEHSSWGWKCITFFIALMPGTVIKTALLAYFKIFKKDALENWRRWGCA